MEIELERTFLLKNIPAGMEKCKSKELCDLNIDFRLKLLVRKRSKSFHFYHNFSIESVFN